MTLWNRHSILVGIKNLNSKLKRRPTKWDSPILYSASRKYFGTWNNAMEKAGYKVKRYQHVKLSGLTSDLFYFVGLVSTDGHIQYLDSVERSGYRILIFTSYSDERDLIVKLIEKLFNYTPLVRERKYGWNVRKNYEIHISSKLLADFLINNMGIPSGNKSKKIRINSRIFNGKRAFMKGFLRGVIDGDGGIRKKMNYITISSGSVLFLRDVSKLLKLINVKTGEIRKSSKNSDTWEVGIYGKDNILRVYKELYKTGPAYPRKVAALRMLLSKK